MRGSASGRAHDARFRRLFAVNAAAGVAAGLATCIALLVFDAHRLRSLLLADWAPWQAIALLAFGFLIGFAALAICTSVMMLGRSDGGAPGHSVHLAPVRARRPPSRSSR
jgi:hypothetical protein